MKFRVFAMTCMLCLSMCSFAQKNPVAGYIITLQGDTINGTIDFLSRGKSALACLFKADNEDEYTSYLPTQILGYRLANNGVYFVSRKFPVDDKERWIFAEYILQGSVSLYRYEVSWTDVTYYFVNENGELAVLKDPGELKNYTADDAFDIKLEALKPAMAMFDKSDKAKNKLWTKSLTAENLLLITREYNKEYCKGGDESVVFEYSAAKSSAVDLRLYVEGGVFTGNVDLGDDFYPDMSGVHLGIGGEWFFPRVNDHFSMQILLALNRVSGSGDSRPQVNKWGNVEYHNWNVKFYDIHVQGGVNYRLLPKSLVTPVLSGGLLFNVPYINENGDKGMLPSSESGKTVPFDVGLYFGGGAEFKLGRQRLSLTARYELPVTRFYFEPKGVTVALGVAI